MLHTSELRQLVFNYLELNFGTTELLAVASIYFSAKPDGGSGPKGEILENFVSVGKTVVFGCLYFVAGRTGF